jgi:hypothetical protein
LLEREDELLKTADRVFTGGPSLYHAKKGRHPACEPLAMSDDEKRRRIRLMRDKLSRTSWNVTAESMHALLEQPGVSEPALKRK